MKDCVAAYVEEHGKLNLSIITVYEALSGLKHRDAQKQMAAFRALAAGYNATVMARKAPPPRGPQLDLASDLSVAFVNTAGARRNNRQLGAGSYADLLTWGRQAGLLSPLEAERLSRRAAEQPWAAKAAFAAAEKLRSALSRTFSAISAGKGPAAADLGTVSDALAAKMPALRLVQGEHGVTWSWAGDENALDQVLWPVLLAAADLLTSEGGRPRIGQCAAESCALFFAQRSPARERVWCDMKTCGARARSLRYYHRRGKFTRNKDWLYPPL